MPIDKEKVKQNFSKSAKNYDRYAGLQQEVMRKLFASLESEYKHILDIGAGTGTLVDLISKKYPLSKVMGIDIAEGMVKVAKSKIKKKNAEFMQGDGEALPFEVEQFDLVVSSLALQWMDAQKVFAEVRRVLKPGGSFYFSTFGPATLGELREAGLSINDFVPGKKLMQLLARHYDRVKMGSEAKIKKYKNVFELFFYLKNIGAQTPGRVAKKGLTTRKQINELFAAQKDGFSCSYEIFYGSGTKS